MQALTLHDPYATLVYLLLKLSETRGWQTKYRGELAIHTAKTIPKSSVNLLATDDVVRRVLREHGTLYKERFMPGRVVAVVELYDCVSTNDPANVPPPGSDAYHFGIYTPNRYVWLLRNIRPLATPVPASGRQRLWPLTGEALRQVNEQLRDKERAA